MASEIGRHRVELFIAAIVGGVVLAAALWAVVWKVVSAAVDVGLDWLIHTFGNEAARREVQERRRDQGSDP